MKKLIAFAAFAIILAACGGSTGDNTEANASDATKQVAKSKPKAKKVDGEKVYKTYCVTCHGIYGDMGASGAFNLTTSELTLEEKIEVISNGRNTMTPFKDLLSEEKIKAVAEYAHTLKKDEE